MITSTLFGLGCPAWLSTQVWLPAVVGGGVGLLVVATLHALGRPAAAAAPAPEKPKQDFDPFVHGSASEQRSSHRRRGSPVEVLIRPAAGEGAQWRGYVLDRSTGGMCLRVEKALDAGVQLHVRPANAPPITPWIEIEVKSARQTTDGWELGCQFVRTPPWALLLMFG
jgi:hypothetical protein